MRTVALAVGFVCAVTASITIFMTENPEYLRIGILVALWGFVFAALAAGRRQTEQVMAASTEVDLRKNYELELEREVAARREYELRLEAQLRREVQEDFSSQVRALHEEMVRLRRELSEQWDSELRVERMVMRTQSVRMGGDRRESLEPARSERASIDATPIEAERWEAAEHVETDPPAEAEVPAPFVSPAYTANWTPPATRDEPTYEEPTQDGPGTTEFPVVANVSPPVRTAPVPIAAPESVVPPPPPYAQPSGPEPDDVLARILTESGVSAGGRRRKHRYADED